MSRRKQYRWHGIKVTVAVAAFLALVWFIPSGPAVAESAPGSSTVKVTVLDSIAIGGNARGMGSRQRQHAPQYQTRLVMRAISSILGRIEAVDGKAGHGVRLSSPAGNSDDGFDDVPWSGILLIITATHL